MSSEILKKIDEIISLIEESDDYKKYLLLQEKIRNNNEIMVLIKKVKVLQKDVIHHIRDESELKMIMDELNSHPLYREYCNTIEELNNTYAIIESSLNKYFQDKLN